MKVCLRRYGPPIAVIASLYLLNRFWLVPRTAGLSTGCWPGTLPTFWPGD